MSNYFEFVAVDDNHVCCRKHPSFAHRCTIGSSYPHCVACENELHAELIAIKNERDWWQKKHAEDLGTLGEIAEQRDSLCAELLDAQASARMLAEVLKRDGYYDSSRGLVEKALAYPKRGE